MFIMLSLLPTASVLVDHSSLCIFTIHYKYFVRVDLSLLKLALASFSSDEQRHIVVVL
jgi:hypothetical protein